MLLRRGKRQPCPSSRQWPFSMIELPAARRPATYRKRYKMDRGDKPLRWMLGTLQTPPVGAAARIEAGVLLRRLQKGESLGMPHSRALQGIGRRVRELRVDDRGMRLTWRIIYRIDPDAILVVHWFDKKTQRTAKSVIDLCRRRLQEYDRG